MHARPGRWVGGRRAAGFLQRQIDALPESYAYCDAALSTGVAYEEIAIVVSLPWHR